MKRNFRTEYINTDSLTGIFGEIPFLSPIENETENNFATDKKFTTRKNSAEFDPEELKKLLFECEEENPIKKSDFYRCEKEKTYQNWFAYELALTLNEGYRKNLPQKFLKNPMEQQRYAEFAIFYAREISSGLLKSQTRNKQLPTINKNAIEKFFGAGNKTLIRLIAAISENQISLHMKNCHNCPSACFKHPEQYCPDFEQN